MKKFFLLLLVMVPVLGFSQEKYQMKIDSAAKRVYFQEVIQIENHSLSKTKELILLWYASSFSNTKSSDLIETENSISFEFTSGYRMSKIMTALFEANHHCFIQIKENRIRIKISEIDNIKGWKVEQNILRNDLTFRSSGETLKQNIETDITNLILKLQQALSKKDDNW